MVALVMKLVPWFKKKCKECEKKMMANQAAKKKQPVLQKGNTQAPGNMPPTATPMKKPGGHCFSARMNADRHLGKSPLADRELLGRRVRSWCEGEPGYAASHAHRYTRKDPNLHRVIWFMQETEDGQSVEFGLLRSLLWMEENGAYQEGDRVAIDQPEMGVPGLAQILRIDRCPDLEESPGCLVTGWYRHSHGEIWEVVLEGGETIETTAQHPFWSADRLAFVPASELRPGEHLSGRDGFVRVLSVRKRPGFEPVYNIEVEGDHCYRVGEQGLLVHNASWNAVQIKTKEGTGGHYARRSNAYRNVRSFMALWAEKGRGNLGFLFYQRGALKRYLGVDGTAGAMTKISPVIGNNDSGSASHAEQLLFDDSLPKRASLDKPAMLCDYEILEIFTERSPCQGAGGCATFLTMTLKMYDLDSGQLINKRPRNYVQIKGGFKC